MGILNGYIQQLLYKPTYAYKGESEQELLNKLEQLVHGTKKCASNASVKSPLGIIFISEEHEDVPFLLNDAYYGWTMALSN